MSAKLYFKWGTMGSGKSMLLLASSFNFERSGIGFICIKSSIDTRDENIIKSRVVSENRDSIIVDKDTDIYVGVRELLNLEHDIKWILVDEAQFLTTAQVDQLSDIVDEFNINIVCYGLRTDFKTNLFDGSKRLFEIADSLEEIKASCSCGKKTIVNARFDENNMIIQNGEQVLVGDSEYIPLCRKCYKEALIKKYLAESELKNELI